MNIDAKTEIYVSGTAERLKKELYGRGLKYHIESYGCQMNGRDSETAAGLFESMGYERAQGKNDADVIIFNTCCVRDHAEKRVSGNVGALKKLKDEKPSLLIGICGCMMQQETVAKRFYKRFPYVDFIFGTNGLASLPDCIERALAGERTLDLEAGESMIEGLPVVRDNGISACVNIMYGCNNFCTYCIVPYVRGRERSRASADIIAEARSLEKAGFREITLLGQNVNSYSGDGGDDGKLDFPELLRLVSRETGIERIRFMTSHPKDLSPRLISAMAETDRVCPHVHLPVQSGSDEILRAMNRRYTSGHYLDILRDLRKNVADIEITTDIIVGFPGESERDFEETVELVREARFAAAYTFMYSPRTGTKAASMEHQIAQEVKKDRLHRLNAEIAAILKENNQKYIGKRGSVLVEGVDMRAQAVPFGKLPCFKMVYFDGDAKPGDIVTVEITDVVSNSLTGRII